MEQERDYKKEYKIMKSKNKQYLIKVPIDKAKIFEEKVKKNNKTPTEILKRAINRYIEDN